MKIQYVIDGNAVYGVIPLGNDEYVLTSNVFTKRNLEMFDKKKDALYAKLIRDLKGGKPLKNFKTSKYYQYYLERLKKENPEYAI
jgi:hypothetical protein